jgi:hypothetical protein
VKTKLSRVVPLPTYVISSGLSQIFEFIFIFFLFFPFFSEETTSNQADLQDSMETNRLLQKQLKLLNLKFSESCSAPHLATRQQYNRDNTTGALTQVTMIQSALVHPIFKDTYQFPNQLKHEQQPCKEASVSEPTEA